MTPRGIIIFLKQNNGKPVILLLAGLVFAVSALSNNGCGSKKDISNIANVPMPPPKAGEFVPPPRLEIPKYTYSGEKYPDPFVPLSVNARASAPDELVIPNINALSLKGIFTTSRNERIALISGGGYSYTSRDGYLYDARNRMIPGYRCSIGSDSGRVLAGGISREIKIRE